MSANLVGSERAPARDRAAAATLTEERRAALFHEQRSLLFGLAYRMLGSAADAEDMLQDAYLRWQQTSIESIVSPRAFLVTVVSRLCINLLQSARVRRETYTGQWLPEPLATPVEATDTSDESLSMAFLLMLQRLSTPERIVFLLREVLDYPHAEIARIIGESEVYCRQILRRARQHVRRARARFAPTHTLHARVLAQFQTVVAGGELQPLLALLAEDAVLYSDGGGKGPALPVPIVGAAKVARGILGAQRKLVPKTLTTKLMRVNGQPALVSFLKARTYSVLLLDLADGRIRNIYIISNPDKLTHVA